MRTKKALRIGLPLQAKGGRGGEKVPSMLPNPAEKEGTKPLRQFAQRDRKKEGGRTGCLSCAQSGKGGERSRHPPGKVGEKGGKGGGRKEAHHAPPRGGKNSPRSLRTEGK